MSNNWNWRLDLFKSEMEKLYNNVATRADRTRIMSFKSQNSRVKNDICN